MKKFVVDLGDSKCEIIPQSNELVDIRLVGVNGMVLGVAVTIEQARAIRDALSVAAVIAGGAG